MGDSAPGEAGARFKGKLGMAVRKSVKDLLSEHHRDRDAVIGRLPPDVRWFLTERLVATQWYPIRGAGPMLEAIALELGLDPLVCARRIGGDVAYESAGRVGRTVISLFGTPARVARHLGSMWGQLYDSGVVEGTYDDGTGVLGVRRREWRGHDPITCITLLGSLERIVEHMSGVELRSAQRVLCLSDSGGDECRFEVRLRTR